MERTKVEETKLPDHFYLPKDGVAQMFFDKLRHEKVNEHTTMNYKSSSSLSKPEVFIFEYEKQKGDMKKAALIAHGINEYVLYGFTALKNDPIGKKCNDFVEKYVGKKKENKKKEKETTSYADSVKSIETLDRQIVEVILRFLSITSFSEGEERVRRLDIIIKHIEDMLAMMERNTILAMHLPDMVCARALLEDIIKIRHEEHALLPAEVPAASASAEPASESRPRSRP